MLLEMEFFRKIGIGFFLLVILCGWEGGLQSSPPTPLDLLPNFSRAGFAGGDGRFDFNAPRIDIRDYGAEADDDKDDTKAIERALSDAKQARGVVWVPEGQWILSRPLFLDESYVGILGAGSGLTTLFIKRSLSDVSGWNQQLSFSGGFIEMASREEGETVLGKVTGTHPVESRVLTVRWQDGETRPRENEWVQLRWHNDEGNTLTDYLYGGVVPENEAGEEMLKAGEVRVREWARVKRVQGERVTFFHPVHVPIIPAWKVKLLRAPHVSHVGIKGFKILFKYEAYAGHLKEKGWNAVFARGVVNGWIEDLEIRNADLGVVVNDSRFVTGKKLKMNGRKLHHALSFSWSSDCVFDSWKIEASHVHGTTISTGAHNNVFSRGFGKKLKMDAHRRQPFQNLHTQIEIEHGKDEDGQPRDPNKVFSSSGREGVGLHAAAFNVYWNIYHDFSENSPHKVTFGPFKEWPRALFMGWRGDRQIKIKKQTGKYQWVDSTGKIPVLPVWDAGRGVFVPEKIRNLYLYQRSLR